MTQTDRILRHMREQGGITAAEAMSEYGIYRLAARIADLKKLGHDIETERVKSKNRYGESVSFARYTIKEDKKYA